MLTAAKVTAVTAGTSRLVAGAGPIDGGIIGRVTPVTTQPAAMIRVVRTTVAVADGSPAANAVTDIAGQGGAKVIVPGAGGGAAVVTVGAGGTGGEAVVISGRQPGGYSVTAGTAQGGGDMVCAFSAQETRIGAMAAVTVVTNTQMVVACRAPVGLTMAVGATDGKHRVAGGHAGEHGLVVTLGTGTTLHQMMRETADVPA